MMPLISLSVPVYGTESSLPALLDSILEQGLLINSVQVPNEADNSFIEVLIVNDGSPGSPSLPQIIKPYKKKFKSLEIPLTILEHRKNQGSFEARRTLVESARGDYLLFADSDDTLPTDALVNFYEGLLASGNGEILNAADIIHGKMDLILHAGDKIDYESLKKFEQKSKVIQLVFDGFISGEEILDSFFIKKNHNGFLCAKLFRTCILRSAYKNLPHTYCTNAEDFLLYFFILLEKPSYYGIDKVVYNYSQDSGITSSKKITSLERWEKVCSTSSVFTIIFSYLNENPFPENSADYLIRELRVMCNTYLASNISQLQHLVIPSLREEAYSMLCDYWGESYVKKIEEEIKGS